MSVGKAIVRVEDSYDGLVLYYADGTATRFTSDDRICEEPLDYAAVRERNASAQGFRERERMRRLHDSLHPRDRQYLQLQARERDRRERERLVADARAGKDGAVFALALRDEFSGVLKDRMADMADMNRILFASPREKRKHRPVRRSSASSTMTIPVKRKKP